MTQRKDLAITSAFRTAKPVLTLFAIAASACIAYGQPAGFVEDFNGPTLDPAWTQGGDLAGHPGTIAGSYDMTDAFGPVGMPQGVKLSRSTSGTPSSFTQEIEVILDPFLLMGAGGTLSDFKWKSFGADGFVEVVFNSFGDMRLFHNNTTAASAGDLQENTNIGYADGDLLKLTTDYDQGADTLDVTYSLNGGSAVPFYSGTGNGGSIGDIITSLVEVEVFKFGDAVPDQAVAAIDRWTLSGGATITGDFNNDGLWNCLDINALTDAVAMGSADLSFDMNGDGSITFADVTDPAVGWLAVGGTNNPAATGGNAFLIADATLDGNVDGQDFLEWNNSKFTSNTQWCDGNFNGDTSVDGQDFLEWNNNKFMSSDGVTAVPEPMGGGLLLVPIVCAFLARVWRQ